MRSVPGPRAPFGGCLFLLSVGCNSIVGVHDVTLQPDAGRPDAAHVADASPPDAHTVDAFFADAPFSITGVFVGGAGLISADGGMELHGHFYWQGSVMTATDPSGNVTLTGWFR